MKNILCNKMKFLYYKVANYLHNLFMHDEICMKSWVKYLVVKIISLPVKDVYKKIWCTISHVLHHTKQELRVRQ